MAHGEAALGPAEPGAAGQPGGGQIGIGRALSGKAEIGIGSGEIGPQAGLGADIGPREAPACTGQPGEAQRAIEGRRAVRRRHCAIERRAFGPAVLDADPRRGRGEASGEPVVQSSCALKGQTHPSEVARNEGARVLQFEHDRRERRGLIAAGEDQRVQRAEAELAVP